MNTLLALLILLVAMFLVLLVFGGSQLPKLAKNLGKAQKEFKDGLSEGLEDDKASDASTTDSQN